MPLLVEITVQNGYCIAEDKDLTINLRHIMDFGEGKFEAKVLNTGQIVHDMPEFLDVAGEYV